MFGKHNDNKLLAIEREAFDVTFKATAIALYYTINYMKCKHYSETQLKRFVNKKLKLQN